MHIIQLKNIKNYIWFYSLTFLDIVYELIYILTFVKLREVNLNDLNTLFGIEQMTSNYLKSPYANTLITFTAANMCL